LKSGRLRPSFLVSFSRCESSSASPVHEIWRRSGRSPALTKSRKRERTDGTKCATVTAARAMVSRTTSNSRCSPSGTTTDVQPRYIGTHISGIEQSKVAGVFSRNTSRAVKPVVVERKAKSTPRLLRRSTACGLRVEASRGALARGMGRWGDGAFFFH